MCDLIGEAQLQKTRCESECPARTDFTRFNFLNHETLTGRVWSVTHQLSFITITNYTCEEHYQRLKHPKLISSLVSARSYFSPIMHFQVTDCLVPL